MEDMAFYRDEETFKFAQEIKGGEEILLNILVEVRNGTMTPVQAYKKIEEIAAEIVEEEATT